MIVVENLCKSFGDHQVLKNISEHIHPGEKVVIIGPSGSGKSTFLRSLNLLEQPTSGSITFEGTVITDAKTDIDAIRRQMGIPARKNICAGRQTYNISPSRNMRCRM